jgi:hypothetical protein
MWHKFYIYIGDRNVSFFSEKLCLPIALKQQVEADYPSV